MEYATWTMILELNSAIRIGRLKDMDYVLCLRCRELIAPDAVVCRYCGRRAKTAPSWRLTESWRMESTGRQASPPGAAPSAA